jgi:hypothetical protein
VEFEYLNERDLYERDKSSEDEEDLEEDLAEYHTERETLAPFTIPPFNQESLHTFTPSLPPFPPKRTVWICVKCDTEQSDDKRRCGTCKSWKGGKREAMKSSKPTKKDKETPNISAAGRKKECTSSSSIA